MLASTEDFATITGTTLDGDTTTRVERLLALASDSVLASAHGQTIVEATTTETVRSYEGVFYLPQRPATAVSSVVINGLTVSPDDYRLEPGGGGRPAKLIRRYYGGDSRWGQALGYPWDEFPGRYPYVGRYPEAEAVVTYTHGWDPVPGQLIGAVVAMANGVLLGAGGGPETSQLTVAGYSETFREGQSADFSVTTSTQAIIDRLCKVSSKFQNVPVAS